MGVRLMDLFPIEEQALKAKVHSKAVGNVKSLFIRKPPFGNASHPFSHPL